MGLKPGSTPLPRQIPNFDKDKNMGYRPAPSTPKPPRYSKTQTDKEYMCPKCKNKEKHPSPFRPKCDWCSELFKKDILMGPVE